MRRDGALFKILFSSLIRGARPALFAVAALAACAPHTVLAQAPQQQEEVEPLPPESTDCNPATSSVDPDCLAQNDLANAGLDGAFNKIGQDTDSPRLHVDPSTRLDRARLTSSGFDDEGQGQNAPRRKRPNDRTPPQPPSEFQKFVQSSTGQMLPVFGASLFDQVPSTFAPLDRIPVTADYVIGPGDEIMLRVWGQVTLNRQLTVDRSGAIYIPQVGQVNVSGLQFQQLDSYLRHQLSRVYRNFEMTAGMGQLRSIQIFVMGEARRPGNYTVSSLSTLINALFASGGPSPQGSMRRVQLKRGSQTVIEFDLYDLLMRGDKSKDVRLSPGDVIYIPPAGAQVAISGSVKTPAIYELKSEHTVKDLIQMACGLTAMADTQRATLERIADHSSRRAVSLPLEAGSLETPVQDGDILRVVSVAPRFANSVTLRGNVANPGRFGWREGMRLRDIIPDKDSLVTRNYWQKRNLLGYISPLDEGPSDPAVEQRRKPAEVKIETVAPEINWSYAVIERQNGRNLTNELVTFNPGKLVLEGDEGQNLPLEPGDVVTIFSQADFQVTVLQQTRYVRLEGEFNSAGVYGVEPGETLGQLIQRAGGLTAQAYLYGAQFLRESTKKEQQVRLDQFVMEMERQSQQTIAMRTANAPIEETALLSAQAGNEQQRIQRLRRLQATGRIVLDLNPNKNDLSKLMNLQLEDGDRFIVPPRPATVNVLGAIYNANSFLNDPQLRIRDYVEKAGGYTRTADKTHVYLIRADGSVVPRNGHESLLGKAFDAGHLEPGDTIVVPEAIMKTTLMKGLHDWSQVISGFGLGAAAINVLR
jgi:protein involved in polysaccharide export with SLBB domain